MKRAQKQGWKKTIAAGLAVCMLAGLPVCPVQAVGAGSAIAKGIDVSKHNLAIDWSQVPGSGISFAFVKAGSTNSGVDPYFDANMQGANAAGLLRRFFHAPRKKFQHHSAKNSAQ